MLKLHDYLRLIPSDHAYQTTRGRTKQHLLLTSVTEEFPLFLPTPGFTSFPSLGLPAIFNLSPTNPSRLPLPFY